MPQSPSSTAQAAREALAVRLAHLRKDAGLTGQALSTRCGWHPAKTTRIQKGTCAPSDADIRAWCAACGADSQADDLIATARTVDSMYLEWRRRQRSGMRRTQEDFNSLYEHTEVCRVYASNVMPGFFQTSAYATALLTSITRFQNTPNDVTDAVATRLARSRLLYQGAHRFGVLLEEAVLRYRLGDAATMRAQLHHLLDVMPLPSVSVGIIPFTAARTVWPLEAFYLHDQQRATVETLTAEITITQPRELDDYRRAFCELSAMAVFGDPARALIQTAINTHT